MKNQTDVRLSCALVGWLSGILAACTFACAMRGQAWWSAFFMFAACVTAFVAVLGACCKPQRKDGE